MPNLGPTSGNTADEKCKQRSKLTSGIGNLGVAITHLANTQHAVRHPRHHFVKKKIGHLSRCSQRHNTRVRSV